MLLINRQVCTVSLIADFSPGIDQWERYRKNIETVSGYGLRQAVPVK